MEMALYKQFLSKFEIHKDKFFQALNQRVKNQKEIILNEYKLWGLKEPDDIYWRKRK